MFSCNVLFRFRMRWITFCLLTCTRRLIIHACAEGSRWLYSRSVLLRVFLMGLEMLLGGCCCVRYYYYCWWCDLSSELLVCLSMVKASWLKSIMVCVGNLYAGVPPNWRVTLRTCPWLMYNSPSLRSGSAIIFAPLKKTSLSSLRMISACTRYKASLTITLSESITWTLPRGCVYTVSFGWLLWQN